MKKSAPKYNPLFKILVALIAFIGVAYSLLSIYIYLNQQQFIYYPDSRPFENCPDLKDTTQKKAGTTRFYEKNISNKVIVFYHGNAGNACDRARVARIFEELGYSFLLVEYQGYAGDQSAPTHAGIKQNVLDIFYYLKTTKYQQVVIVGESIGSGPSLIHSQVAPATKLILVTPFKTLPELARYHYPFLLPIIENAYQNDLRISEYKGKLLFLVAEKDEIMPISQTQKLFSNSQSNEKSFVLVKNATHNSIYQSDQTKETLKQFLSGE